MEVMSGMNESSILVGLDLSSKVIQDNSKSNSAISLLPLLIILPAIIWKIFLVSSSKSQRLPPGPRGFPVVGCLFQLRRSLTSGNFEDLIQKFGPIFTLKVASTPSIIITDAQIAHEAFVEMGSLFASRPRTASAEIVSGNFTNISSSVYGPVWRTLRRNLVSGIIHSSKASTLKQVREEVVLDLLRRFSGEAAQNGGIVQVRPIIRYGTFNLLSSLCFGKQVAESVVLDIAQVINQILHVRSRTRIDEFIPCLKTLMPWIVQTTKEERELGQQERSTILPLIKEAQMLHQDGKLSQGSYIHSLLAVDLQHQITLSDEDLINLCCEFFIGASDTTITALEWAIANVIIQPSIQARIVNEIERVVGKRVVNEEDIRNLPYLEAVVKETLRRHPPGYITLPHAVTQPCKLQGFDIPLNAKVYVSIWSFSNDPRIWVNPTAFKPERFIDSDLDITGSRRITAIPFGTGRRICPGLGLAMLHLSFLLARLVQSFEWSTCASHEDIDVTATRNFTMVMKTPLTALITKRP